VRRCWPGKGNSAETGLNKAKLRIAEDYSDTMQNDTIQIIAVIVLYFLVCGAILLFAPSLAPVCVSGSGSVLLIWLVLELATDNSSK
jgi:hypothetical protein